MNAKAIVFSEFGAPGEVLRLEELEIDPATGGAALVEILGAPINPADINFIQGTYGVRPSLPTTPGMEGIGVVREIGPEATAVKVGDRVIIPHSTGTWRSACLVDAGKLIVVPKEIPAAQAAMLRVNPPTAYRMLRDFVQLEPGDWFIQNAANSGVGTAAIVIAKALGWKSVNVVRRDELRDELLARGADVVLVDGPDLPAQVRKATGGAPIRLALNAVCGENATRCAKCLAFGGTMVTYGAMSRQPMNLSAGALIFRDHRHFGFWVTKWFERATREEIEAMFAEIFPLVSDGRLDVPIDADFSLEEWPAALARAMEGERNGKVLFRM